MHVMSYYYLWQKRTKQCKAHVTQNKQLKLFNNICAICLSLCIGGGDGAAAAVESINDHAQNIVHYIDIFTLKATSKHNDHIYTYFDHFVAKVFFSPASSCVFYTVYC